MKRGLYLSAARSWIFNHALSRRVQAGTWDQLQPGDLAMLDGTRSVFPVQAVDPALQERLERGDVDPSGPLPGAGGTGVDCEVRALEGAVMSQFPVWCAGLVDAGMRHQRRSLRLRLQTPRWQRGEAGSLTLEFTLQRGQFATAVLRECGRFVS
jgi:tRNA pseudouridine13 synthase